MNSHFSKDTETINKHMKKMFNILRHEGNANLNLNDITTRQDHTLKWKITNVSEDVKKARILKHCW